MLLRSLPLLLIAALVLGVSGVLPVAAASAECCDAGCDDDEEHAPAAGVQGEESHGDGADDTGCAPLCTSCVCATFFAPAVMAVVSEVPALAAVQHAAWQAFVAPESPPGTGVFHPPRAL